MKGFLFFFICFSFYYVKPNIEITKTGDINLIRKYINNGNFNVSEQDEFGHNSINWAVFVGRLDILTLILESFPIDVIKLVINQPDIVGNTALMNAVISGHFIECFSLLFYGADFEIENELGESPKKLLEKKAEFYNIDIDTQI